MEQRLLIKLAPGQLLLPHPNRGERLLSAAEGHRHLASLLGRRPGLARAEGAEFQRRTQARGAGLTRHVAPWFVAEQRNAAPSAGLAITEVLQLHQRRGLPRPAGAELGALKRLPQLLKAGQVG